MKRLSLKFKGKERERENAILLSFQFGRQHEFEFKNVRASQVVGTHRVRGRYSSPRSPEEARLRGNVSSNWKRR